MNRHVRGSLFGDYVRMVRFRKGVDWSAHLTAEDERYLSMVIEPDSWYPMATFERLGNAILAEIAGNDVEAARMWGQMSVTSLSDLYPQLVADGDPRETLMRFRVYRATFFDFPALDVTSIDDGMARIEIRYHMGAAAEEAAAYQTMGFFEGVLQLAGATAIEAEFLVRAWEGRPSSLLALAWKNEG